MSQEAVLRRFLGTSLKVVKDNTTVRMVLRKGEHPWDIAIQFKDFHRMEFYWNSPCFIGIGERVAAIGEDQFSRFSFGTADEVLDFLLGEEERGPS